MWSAQEDPCAQEVGVRALPSQVVDLLIDGWRKHRSLVTAADATAGQPDAERLVTPGEHQVRSVHEPTVDVIVDVVVDLIHVLTLFWRLDIVFDVGVVIAAVRGGRLVALRAGNAKLTGTLAVEGVEITRRSVVIPLTSVLDHWTRVDQESTWPRSGCRSVCCRRWRRSGDRLRAGSGLSPSNFP